MTQQAPPPSPRIERITLQGVGPFDDATFEPLPPSGPGELVLFEGPNGSGKTTTLEAIAVLIGSTGSTSILGATDAALRRRMRADDARVTVQLDGGAVVQFPGPVVTKIPVDPRITAFAGTPWDSALSFEWAAFAFRGAQPTANLASEGPKRLAHPILQGALSFAEVTPASADLGQILVNLYFDQLQAWRAAEQAKGKPEEADLRRQADARQASLDRMAGALSDVLQRNVTIAFPLGQRPPEIRLDGELIPLDLLGEGFRRTVAWLSDLCARLELTRWKDTARSPFDQDFWLLLDEIDQSLHPELQRHILPTVRRLFPNARIYATTHSPFVVASAPDGCVFPICPDPATHHVRGAVAPVKLGPGRSLSWAVEEVFDVPSSFVDEATIDRLKQHKAAVERLRRGEIEGFDWAAFARLRAPLVESEGEGRAVVMLAEAKVRGLVDEKLRALQRGA